MPEILDNAKGALTHKIGPLPAVAWIGIGVGGFVVFHLLTGGSSGGASASPSSGAPSGLDGGFDDSGSGGGGSTGGASGGESGGLVNPITGAPITLNPITGDPINFDPGGGIIPWPNPISGLPGNGPGTTIPTPPVTGPTPPPTAPTGTPKTSVRLSIIGSTPLYDTGGKLLAHGTSGTYDATRINLLGTTFYRFLRKNAAGKPQWTLIHTNAKTIKVA